MSVRTSARCTSTFGGVAITYATVSATSAALNFQASSSDGTWSLKWVVTEPGIYRAELRGGIRYEDAAVVRPGGAQLLGGTDYGFDD